MAPIQNQGYPWPAGIFDETGHQSIADAQDAHEDMNYEEFLNETPTASRPATATFPKVAASSPTLDALMPSPIESVAWVEVAKSRGASRLADLAG